MLFPLLLRVAAFLALLYGFAWAAYHILFDPQLHRLENAVASFGVCFVVSAVLIAAAHDLDSRRSRKH